MSDEIVESVEAVAPSLVEVVEAAPAPVVEPEVVAPAKPDFGDHELFKGMRAHAEQFAGSALARIEQILEEIRALLNQHSA